MKCYVRMNVKQVVSRFYLLNSKSFYFILTIVTLLSLHSLYNRRNGLFIECPCWREIKTEERVAKYFPHLMQEWNDFTNSTVIEDSEKEHQSLAVKFLLKVEENGKSCSSTPRMFGIKHRNMIWQEAQVGWSTFLLFSAFIDHRDEKDGPHIRILAMANTANPFTPTCHLYNSQNISSAVATKAVRVDYLHWQEPKSGEWQPFLITCKANWKSQELPDVVSIVSNPCSWATNALRIVHYKPPTPYNGKVALCHKFLFNSAVDSSARLVEWIEAARSWGIDHITFYEFSCHPNVRKVLSFYQKSNFITVRKWVNPGTQVNIPSLLRVLYDTQRYVLFTDENIPYTDCFLHHLGTHEYVGIWDMDEFMLPVSKSSIPDLMGEAFRNWRLAHRDDSLAKPPTSYLARGTYFFDDRTEKNLQIPRNLQLHNNVTLSESSYLHMLSHVERTVKFCPVAVFTKSIHSTSRALGLHAHFALFNLEGEVDRDKDLYHLYPSSEGYLAHYRDKCQGESQSICNELYRPFLTRDTTMWKHFDEIYINTQNTLARLNL